MPDGDVVHTAPPGPETHEQPIGHPKVRAFEELRARALDGEVDRVRAALVSLDPFQVSAGRDQLQPSEPHHDGHKDREQQQDHSE